MVCSSPLLWKDVVDIFLGRAFAIVTRDHGPRGYVDIDIDDYSPDSLLGTLTNAASGSGDHRAKVSVLFSGSVW
jgi:hypothetical protein